MPNKIKERLTLAARVLLNGTPPRDIRSNLPVQDIPSITPGEVDEAKVFFPLEKFFIFGHARSGTTILARLIRLHPDVHCNYQAHFFTRPPLLHSLVADEDIRVWLTRRSNRWNRGEDLSPVVLRAVSDFILERDARREGKHIVGDKSPSSLMDGAAVQLMHKVYPDARLIYIVRDGRDTAISHRFQAFIDFPERLSQEDQAIRADFVRDAEPFLCGERSIFTPKGIRRAAEGWVRNVTETDQMGSELYSGQYISLRYEDLLTKPWEATSRLWTFLGADLWAPGLKDALDAELQHNPDADWQREKAQDIVSVLQKGRQGSWREIFTTQDRDTFQQIAGATLERWGYTE